MLETALEVDLQRFLFPEHPTFVVHRLAVGETRRQVLLRALFNGTGIVVWQDMFGEVLEFTSEERALVRRIASVLRGNAAIFRGADAIPLVPSHHSTIYGNFFVSAESRCGISVWNAAATPVHGELFTLPSTAKERDTVFEDVWNGGELQASADEHGRLLVRGRLAPETSVLIERDVHNGRDAESKAEASRG